MKKFEKKSAGTLERLRIRSGIYASAVTVLVVVLAVLLNLIVRAVPTKYTEFDLSEAGLYTLSGSSKDIAHALTQDVTIYYLAETGSEDAIITKLLDRYASESSHIKWETKDPAVYPTFAAQYGVQSAENGSLILVSGEKSAVLAASDLYDYDYSDYYTTGSYSVTFGGENKLTAAIYRITSGEELHAYYTTNHGEQRLTDTLTDALEGQNLSVSPLDLLTDTIPDDCDLLIINDPQQDLASAGGLVDEMSALRAYLKNGGHLMLTTDSYYSTPNLDALMAEFGLTRTPGLVVEGDSSHYLNGYPYYLLPDYATDTESGTLDGIDTSRRVLLQMAQGITITETEGVTSEALLVSTESSYSKAAGYEMTTAEQEDGDPDGPFALAAYASDNSTGAEVIWVNCGNMDNEAVYQTVPGNVTFLQGCAASLAGQEGTTLVESKALEAAPITISGHTAAVLGLLFVLAAGAALTLLTHANQKAEQAASEAEDGSIPLLDVTIATLESISIQYGGETLTLRLSDDGWTLTEDPTYHLDDSACNTIRTALAGMKAKRQLEAQPGEDYGFDAPQLVVNVSAAGESTTLTVGAENPVTGDVYVRREGGDAVYTVDAARFRCMEQTKAELFGAFSPAGITVSNIEAVRYTLQSGETIKLQSVSQPTEADSTTYQTVWQLTDEPNAALDTDKTDALLAALASYVTGQDTAADLSACGFNAPLVTAEVTTADGTVTLTYAIGTDGYYMMVSGDSSVYTVDGQTVQALCLTAWQLKADT